jgi:hypothetical protein
MAPMNDSKSSDLYTALIGMGLVGAIAPIVIVGLLRWTDALAPHLGDIISFYRSERGDTSARIKVLNMGGASTVRCTLDVHVMRKSGGSMVLESLQFNPRPSYRVHWAGGRTSDGDNDCGVSVDMVLSRSDVIALRSAAGGLEITANGGKPASPFSLVIPAVQ